MTEIENLEKVLLIDYMNSLNREIRDLEKALLYACEDVEKAYGVCPNQSYIVTANKWKEKNSVECWKDYYKMMATGKFHR